MRLFAYLDPGSGSAMLQVLLAGAAGIIVSIKMFGKRIFRTLMFWKRDDETPEAESPESTAADTAARQHETEKEPV
ncbi:MAG: hypothetical protein ACRDKV_04605 [Solirubrobacterales bacterium]